MAIQDSEQLFGAGQARNRTTRAVERTIPFEIACQAVTVTWHATVGRAPGELVGRRRNDQVLAGLDPAGRRKAEGTLGGLRFVRNWMGYHADPADFIAPR